MEQGPGCRPAGRGRARGARRRELWRFARDAVRASSDNKVLRLAAALAYYAMFALAPLLIIVVVGARLALGERSAEAEVVAQLGAVVGEAGAVAVATLLGSLRPASSDIATTLIGGVGLLIGASALFSHLRDSLNTIWEVAPKPNRGVVSWLVDRVVAVLLVLSVGVVAFVGFALSIGLTDWAIALAGGLPLLPPWLAVRAAQLGLSVAVITLIVALTYRFLPDCRIAWRDIWVGASATALLIVASQALIGLYLRGSGTGSAYGLIGAVVVILVWVYYSAVVFFFGAELTWLYASRYGDQIQPAEHALSLAAGDRAAQGLLRADELAEVAEAQAREVGS